MATRGSIAARPTGKADRGFNPVVFLDIQIGGREVGRVLVELRKDLCPAAAENFRSLCTGERGIREDGVRMHYKGTRIHRVIKDMICQGGDLLNGDGSFSESIYDSRTFADENFILRHTGPGCLSMINSGPDTNGSQFQFSLVETPQLDEKYVVFGAIVDADSMKPLDAVNRVGTPHGETLEEVIISNSGQLYPALAVVDAEESEATSLSTSLTAQSTEDDL